jgi:hypothetical protein
MKIPKINWELVAAAFGALAVVSGLVGWTIGMPLTTMWGFIFGFWFCYWLLYYPAKMKIKRANDQLDWVSYRLSEMLEEINKQEKEKKAQAEQSLQE